MKLMKTLKKSISALLAGVMTVMSLSATAFAEYEAIEKESITMKIHKETISNFTGNCDEKITVKNLYDLMAMSLSLWKPEKKGIIFLTAFRGNTLKWLQRRLHLIWD